MSSNKPDRPRRPTVARQFAQKHIAQFLLQMACFTGVLEHINQLLDRTEYLKTGSGTDIKRTPPEGSSRF